MEHCKEFGFYFQWNGDSQKLEQAVIICLTRITLGAELSIDYWEGKGDQLRATKETQERYVLPINFDLNGTVLIFMHK